MRLASPIPCGAEIIELREPEGWDPEFEPTRCFDFAGTAPAAAARIDRNDGSGSIIGYSLITETEWDKTVESFDLDDNLISSSYTDKSGYSYISSWEPVLDATGAATGERYTSVSSDGSTRNHWVEIYDTEGNLLSSAYSSSDGDWETTTRTASPKLSIGPAPLSHALKTSGAWADGTTYKRLELFDTNGNLVRSENVYSDGTSELYTIDPVFSEDGSIEGYQGSWTWADHNGEIFRSTESFDAELNPIWQPDLASFKGLGHIEEGSHSFPVLHEELESHMAYVCRDTPEMTILAEANQLASSYPENTLAKDVSETVLDGDESTISAIAFYATPEGSASTSHQEKSLAKTASTQPFVTRDHADLKLNVHAHRDTRHGMLLGELDLLLRGNKLDNVLIGNDGNNTIAGGRGKDLITGGGGSDYFTFRNQRRSLDTITDFNADEDKFLLKGKEFRNLFTSKGLRLAILGSVLRFDEATGHLLFSAAGEGSSSRPIKLALVRGLEAADFSADLFLLG
jgi:hypothetical protein